MLSNDNQIKAGKLTAKFVEYFGHIYLHTTIFHMQHHKNANKYGMLDPDYQEPWYLNAPGRKEKGTLTFLVALFYPLKPLLPHFYETVKEEAENYFNRHAAAHRDPYLIWEDLPNHALHHALQKGYWGVRSSSIDDLLGTAPVINKEAFEKIKKMYIQRAEKVLPTIKAEAKIKQKKREEKAMNIFNGFMDGLDYVAQKRWKLEKLVRKVSSKLPSFTKSS